MTRCGLKCGTWLVESDKSHFFPLAELIERARKIKQRPMR